MLSHGVGELGPASPATLAIIGIMKVATKVQHYLCSANPITCWLRGKRLIEEWVASGRSTPPPHPYKVGIVKRYAKDYKISTLVETGTYYGDMIYANRRYFKNIISVELGYELYTNAKTRFIKYPHIKLHHGDSGELLGSVISDLKKPALFWLDGHFSEGITAKGKLHTPILRELTHIFSSAIPGNVVLIDDARCFDGTNDYPTLETLRGYIAERSPASTVTVADDVIRITP